MSEPTQATQLKTEAAQQLIQNCISACEEIILGKPQQIRLAISCLLAGGHLLIEDIPGVGKTTLAQTLAKVLGLSYQRIQFTSDLLPADILGSAIYDRDQQAFEFQPGPIFHQCILADEINRTTPKTQSALLEAMEEQQVTTEGKTLPLPKPFFVIATQNPLYQAGTFPLPESQLDRFLMRIHLGYPERDAEQQLLAGTDRRSLVAVLKPLLNNKQLTELQSLAQAQHCSAAVLEYTQRLLDASRESGVFVHGLSPRAGLGLLNAARAWSWLANRSFVIPEDIQAVLTSVVAHRLAAHKDQREAPQTLVQQLIESVSIP